MVYLCSCWVVQDNDVVFCFCNADICRPLHSIFENRHFIRRANGQHGIEPPHDKALPCLVSSTEAPLIRRVSPDARDCQGNHRHARAVLRHNAGRAARTSYHNNKTSLNLHMDKRRSKDKVAVTEIIWGRTLSATRTEDDAILSSWLSSPLFFMILVKCCVLS